MRKRRRFKTTRSKTKFLRIFKIAIALGLISLILIFGFNQFKIKNVYCQKDASPCTASITAQLNQLQNKPYYRLQLSNTIEKLKSADPTINDISYSYSFPQSINFSLTSALPLAQVRASSQSATFIVSSNFKITDILATPSSSPKLIFFPLASEFSVGSSIKDTNLEAAVNLVDILNQNFIPFNQILALSPAKTTISLSNSSLAYLDLNQSLKPQITRLQLILNQYQQSEISTIDVRFEKPVITFIDTP